MSFHEGRQYRKGTKCKFADSSLVGLLGKILKQSKVTGDLTIQLLEGYKGWKIGDVVQVKPHEIQVVK